jgi:hypothetical protein
VEGEAGQGEEKGANLHRRRPACFPSGGGARLGSLLSSEDRDGVERRGTRGRFPHDSEGRSSETAAGD